MYVCVRTHMYVCVRTCVLWVYLVLLVLCVQICVAALQFFLTGEEQKEEEDGAESSSDEEVLYDIAVSNLSLIGQLSTTRWLSWREVFSTFRLETGMLAKLRK